jgi:hypothetical protein
MKRDERLSFELMETSLADCVWATPRKKSERINDQERAGPPAERMEMTYGALPTQRVNTITR